MRKIANVFKLNEDEIKLDQDTTEVQAKPVGDQDPSLAATAETKKEPSAEKDETKVQKAEVDASIVKDEAGDASKKVSDQTPEMVVDPALKGTIKVTEDEEDNKELTAGNAGDIENKPVGSQDPKAVDDPALKGNVKAQQESKKIKESLVYAEGDSNDSNGYLKKLLIDLKAAKLATSDDYDRTEDGERVISINYDDIKRVQDIINRSGMDDKVKIDESITVNGKKYRLLKEDESAERIVNNIIKKNSRFSWLKKELPSNYSKKDVEDILNRSGYGNVYDDVISELKEDEVVITNDANAQVINQSPVVPSTPIDPNIPASMPVEVNKDIAVIDNTTPVVPDVSLANTEQPIIDLEPEFVIFENAPRAVISKTADTVTIIYEAISGTTKTIKKSQIKESFKIKEEDKKEDEKKPEDDKKEGEDKAMKESLKKKVYTVKEEVKIIQDVGFIILESKDKFIVLEAEEKEPEEIEKKEEDAKKDANGKYPFEKGYVKEAEGDEKDNKEDAEKAKAAGMSIEDWEKSEKDKEHDKKQESVKKIYKVKEEVSIIQEDNSLVILEKGDKFMLIEQDEQKPDPQAADKKEDESKKIKESSIISVPRDLGIEDKFAVVNKRGEILDTFKTKEEAQEYKKNLDESFITVNGKKYKAI
jgi:hypothetical protein